ncbi:pre-mRNA-splicing factor CWC25 homolog [Oppia nitens]|uniref:pre-mRNA-splicing factor CWC25 homolog n=1 Tax=Oppia nitens TaxID=1686743 RepID=UPI0023DBE597|nr:pre-mRNA-splicing factor CWC25 homolog [Oppia nitens]
MSTDINQIEDTMGDNKGKLDWMYKGVRGLVDNEDYLTGRKIDKTFEIISAEENPTKGDLEGLEGSVPQSVFDLETNTNTNNMVTVDLAAKLREDPLYEIRLKQREQRRKLLDNPLKMKKLKNILESTLSDDKKHKKKHKHRRSDSDSSDSHHKSDGKRHKRDKNRDERRNDHKNSSNSHRHHRQDSYRDRDRHTRDSRERILDKKLSSIYKRHDSRIEKTLSDEKQRTEQQQQSRPKKLSAEEMEKKRLEMLDNAVWRECQRKSNVKEFANEEQKEKEFNESGKSAQFIKPLLTKATDDTLEDRIRQKRFSHQKGHNSMDTNFARR